MKKTATRYSPGRPWAAWATPTTMRLAEMSNGLYKVEVIHRRSLHSREAVERAALQWVGLVQPSAPAGVDREHPAGRSRGELLSADRELAMAA